MVVKIALLEFSLLIFVATVFKCRRIGWMDYVDGREENSKAYSDMAGICLEVDGV